MLQPRLASARARRRRTRIPSRAANCWERHRIEEIAVFDDVDRPVQAGFQLTGARDGDLAGCTVTVTAAVDAGVERRGVLRQPIEQFSRVVVLDRTLGKRGMQGCLVTGPDGCLDLRSQR